MKKKNIFARNYHDRVWDSVSNDANCVEDKIRFYITRYMSRPITESTTSKLNNCITVYIDTVLQSTGVNNEKVK